MDTRSETTESSKRVLVSGYLGKMGLEVAKAVDAAADLVLAGGFDPAKSQESILVDGKPVAPAFTDLEAAIEAVKPDVMVDFTLPSVAAENLEIALKHGIDCVLGTTGVLPERLEQLANDAPEGTCLFVAPNFTTGAVLMMAASKLAAKYFDDVEIIEFHHNNKKDAPSGTALATAELINNERLASDVISTAPGRQTELPQYGGARGAEYKESKIQMHSVRSNGFVASQEVIFGSSGQTLTIRHDSFDRSSYMPGVLLAVRKVGTMSGLVIGLEELMLL